MVVFLEFSQGLVLPTKTTSNKVQTTNHNQAEISKVQYMYMQCGTVDLKLAKHKFVLRGRLYEARMSYPPDSE